MFGKFFAGNNRLRFISEIGLLVLIVTFLIFGRNIDNGDRQTGGEDFVPADVTGAVQTGVEAPDFTLMNVNNEQVTLSELRGKPVIINFWATWCAPCRDEMPEFQEIIEVYASEELQLLALNREESSEQVAEFFEELSAEEGMEFTFPSLLDSRSDVASLYGVFNMPTTFFVDANGMVTAVHFGELNRDQLDGYLADTLAAATN